MCVSSDGSRFFSRLCFSLSVSCCCVPNCVFCCYRHCFHSVSVFSLYLFIKRLCHWPVQLLLLLLLILLCACIVQFTHSFYFPYQRKQKPTRPYLFLKWTNEPFVRLIDRSVLIPSFSSSWCASPKRLLCVVDLHSFIDFSLLIIVGFFWMPILSMISMRLSECRVYYQRHGSTNHKATICL